MWCVVGILIFAIGGFYWGYYTKQKEYDEMRQKWLNSQKEVERLKLANKMLSRGKDDD